jgi:hypothetical protein
MATRKSPASTEKKTTTRTRKASQTSVAETAAPVTETTRQHHAPNPNEIAQLAEQFWNERGRPFGSPEVDWLRAEATLSA